MFRDCACIVLQKMLKDKTRIVTAVYCVCLRSNDIVASSVVIGESVNLDNRSSTEFVADDVDFKKIFDVRARSRLDNKENLAASVRLEGGYVY